MEFRWRDEPDAPPPTPGGIIVTSFPSAGLAPTIAAHYIVRALNLPRLAVLESNDATPIAVVQGGTVQPAIRVHGNQSLAVVMSEFPTSPVASWPLTAAILGAAERRGAKMVVALEGVVPHPFDGSEELPPSPMPEVQTWWILSKPDPAASAQFDGAGARALAEGVIGGISGALLLQGQSRSLSVGALLVSVQDVTGYPDHRAGAALIETLDRLLPDLKIDTKPLLEQAVMIEKALRAAARQAKKPADAVGVGHPTDTMIYQ
jgi:predicted ATP-grasp superfamily ATP-dependent carboligase